EKRAIQFLDGPVASFRGLREATDLDRHGYRVPHARDEQGVAKWTQHPCRALRDIDSGKSWPSFSRIVSSSMREVWQSGLCFRHEPPERRPERARGVRAITARKSVLKSSRSM